MTPQILKLYAKQNEMWLETYKSLRGRSCKTSRVPDSWLFCNRLPIKELDLLLEKGKKKKRSLVVYINKYSQGGQRWQIF